MPSPDSGPNFPPAGGAWVEVGTPIVATGTLVEITVPTDAEAGAFYQVRVVAP